ncbi:MAG: SpoIID/LytB domain-containing protein [Patescibacteria group bacterium]|nr:SpoIID/LytB domain-containing protein [Patescibacteria group bacterium]
MRRWGIFLTILLLIAGAGRVWRPILADELDDINRQIGELSQAREQSIAATKPLEKELSRLSQTLKEVEAGIAKARADLRDLELSIAEREKEFGQNYVLLAERALSFYKASRQNSSLLILFSNGPAGIMRDLFYRQAATDRDKNEIAQISINLLQLEADKKKVEANRSRLADLQAKADKEAKFFSGEIKGAKDYQAKLSGQIASLSARQQQIVGQRLSSLGLPISLGAGTMICTDDRNLDPGFSPAFAFYTYGIPHRVGMNQYGAYGRAKAGQDYKTILQAYFNGISFESGKEDIKIKIQGNGERSLDEYLLGIYEMPESWDMNALKAQAVAARSYALAYTNNGADEICTTQACQVWKPDKKTGQWKQAVEQTKGEVMINGGQVIKAWYSSTDGGYTFTSGDVWGGDKSWTKRLRDTTGDVGSFDQLKEKAYDKESPCFYSAQGWRSEYAKSAWLKSSEAADITNSLMLAKADSGAGEHLYQTDKPHPFGGEIWNEERVKSELRGKGITPFNSVSNVSVGADFGSGQTNGITITGDAGTKSFSGSEWKNYFNLRAPANIQIVGPLYNVERR